MNWNKWIYFAACTFFVCAFSFNANATSTGECETTKPRVTSFGSISRTECGTARSGYRYSVNVDGLPVLSDTYLSRQDFDEKLGIWIYRGDSLQETGCPDRLYLIDLSKKPVTVIAFGVKKACNEFHWASWGKTRSVIALKNNVKFTYENGKMILPATGETLWKAIEPPHAGTGLGLEDAIPFAEDVPLPK